MVAYSVPEWEEDDKDREPFSPPRFLIRQQCQEIQKKWSAKERAQRKLASGLATYPIRFDEVPEPKKPRRLHSSGRCTKTFGAQEAPRGRKRYALQLTTRTVAVSTD